MTMTINTFILQGLSWFLLVLKAWVLVCASTWFWPTLGITFPIALAIFLVINMICGHSDIMRGIMYAEILQAQQLDQEKKLLKAGVTGWMAAFIHLFSVLLTWGILWILFLMM